MSDFAARIHALGNIWVTLVYSLGDDEFPPAASLLFDAAIKRPFAIEDVVVLSSRICLDLIR